MGCAVFILGAMLIVGLGLSGWWWLALLLAVWMVVEQ